jgi:glycosyl hydrolase family 44
MRVRGVFLGFAFAATALHAASVTVTVDAARDRHPIRPEIYGVTFATASQLIDVNVPLNRWGGNSTTRYNWQLNATNFGSDMFFESLPGDNDPDLFISDARITGRGQTMITIPTMGWAATLGFNRARLSSFSVKKYGTQQATDPAFPDAGNGMKPGKGGPITKNDPLDASIQVDSNFEQQWVQHIVQRWGGVRYYILDNEPSLWHVTHRDVHPTGASMDEVANKMIDTAAKIRAADPNGMITGPEEWGWLGYFYSGMDQQKLALPGAPVTADRDAHGGADYIPYLLSRIRQEEQSRGVRLLDALSVHYSPQGGETGDSLAAAIQLLRNRSTRSLWDPNYTDESINDKVKLIPRLRAWAEAFRPGTPIGITQYDWGVDDDMNGATAEADILGIFGREGLDFANHATTPVRSSVVAKVFQLYRNYDGNGKMFGDTSVRTTVPDPDTLSAFSALRSSDRALTVMIINKDLSQPATVDLQFQNFQVAGKAQRYQLTFTNSIDRMSDLTVPSTIQVPAQSVTLLVVPNGGAPRVRAVQP